MTKKEVLTQIWFSPRKVLRFINDHKYDRLKYVLAFLAGVAGGLDRAMRRDSGDDMSLLGVLAIAIIVSGLIGWLGYYIYAGFCSIAGDWLGGKGNTKSIFRIFIYAAIPTVFSLVLSFVMIAIFGIDLFQSDFDLFSEGWIPGIIGVICMILYFISGIWTLVLTVIGLSEVQKFSIGKSILNLLLPLLVIGIPIILIILFFSVM